MFETTEISKPYTILAEVYDEVMSRVDYELWADFIHEVIQTHHPAPYEVLELACGTASLTFELEKLGYQITGTDKSAEMVEKAQSKAGRIGSDVQFKQMDFLDIQLEKTFDIVVSVFDSINYLLHEEKLMQFFAQVKKVMNRKSLLIFDFTTPKNSLESTQFLDKRKGSTESGFCFFRESKYDADRQIHSNIFEIEKRTNDNELLERFTEEHKQRAYTLNRMLEIIKQTDLTVVAKYGEFDMGRANKNSHRITMALKLN